MQEFRTNQGVTLYLYNWDMDALVSRTLTMSSCNSHTHGVTLYPNKNTNAVHFLSLDAIFRVHNLLRLVHNVENQMDRRIKCLHSDNRNEYKLDVFALF